MERTLGRKKNILGREKINQEINSKCLIFVPKLSIMSHRNLMRYTYLRGIQKRNIEEFLPRWRKM